MAAPRLVFGTRDLVLFRWIPSRLVGSHPLSPVFLLRQRRILSSDTVPSPSPPRSPLPPPPRVASPELCHYADYRIEGGAGGAVVDQAARVGARAFILFPRIEQQGFPSQNQERSATCELGHAGELPRQERSRGTASVARTKICRNLNAITSM